MCSQREGRDQGQSKRGRDSTALVFQSYRNKVPQTGRLKTTEILLGFCSLEVQNQGVCRASLHLKALGENLPCICSRLCRLVAVFDFPGLYMPPSELCHCPQMAFLPVVSSRCPNLALLVRTSVIGFWTSFFK